VIDTNLTALTKCMAVELAPHNIRVNAIAPGAVHTAMTAPFKSTPIYDMFVSRTPMKRWAEPDEIAGTAVFLAGKASSFVTGQTIFVDGGFSVSYF